MSRIEMGWNKTANMIARVGPRLRNGLLNGMPLISRDSRIDKGIYLSGSRARVGISVDFERSGQVQMLYNRILDRSMENGRISKSSLLDNVMWEVREALNYDSKHQLYSIEKTLPPDHLIQLEFFMSFRRADCRAMALLAGVLLERLIDQGHLRGTVSIDRNDDKKTGGHVWARYASPAGIVIIVDPAKNFLGLIDNAGAPWDYHRPGEVPLDQQQLRQADNKPVQGWISRARAIFSWLAR